MANEAVEIKVRCKGSHEFSLKELIRFQDVDGEQLKGLSTPKYNSIKESLIKKGFWFPFKVWQSETGEIYFIDGHQRDIVLRDMSADKEKYKMPEKYPCVMIEAENEKEAAEAILLDNSRYGDINDDGMIAFLNHFDLEESLEDLNDIVDIPEYSLKEMEILLTIKNSENSGDGIVGEDGFSLKETPIIGSVDSSRQEFIILTFPDREAYKEIVEIAGLKEGIRNIPAVDFLANFIKKE